MRFTDIVIVCLLLLTLYFASGLEMQVTKLNAILDDFQFCEDGN